MWIEEILTEVALVTDEQANSLTETKDVYVREHPVGVLTPALKSFRFVVSKYEQAMHEAKQQVIECEEELEADLAIQAALAIRQHDLLDKLYLFSLRLEFPELHNKAFIGIRAGDMVIWSEDAQENRQAKDLLAAAAAGVPAPEIQKYLGGVQPFGFGGGRVDVV